MHDDHSQWSSEGVQVGSVGSAAGVIGCWTGATHDHGLSPLMFPQADRLALKFIVIYRRSRW
jgi:hypothetical protein